jgi:hypothetical protein
LQQEQSLEPQSLQQSLLQLQEEVFDLLLLSELPLAAYSVAPASISIATAPKMVFFIFCFLDFKNKKDLLLAKPG